MSRYDFVSLPDAARRAKREAMVLDRRLPGRCFGRVLLEYECMQPVHVGLGLKDLSGNDVIRLGVTSRGAPIVPGSTLKGVLRARYEAITKSCVLSRPTKNKGDWVKSESQSQRPVNKALLGDQAEKQFDRVDHCRSSDEVCAACALFGFQAGRRAMRSRVTVGDLITSSGFIVDHMPAQWEPRLHHVGDVNIEKRGKGEPMFVLRSLHGRKFAFDDPAAPAEEAKLAVEAIPKGAKLRGSLNFFNIELAEFGGLLCALGHSPRSFLKVGAGKGHGFGRIDLIDMKWDLRDHRRQPIQPDVDSLRAEFMRSADRYGAGEEKLIEIHKVAAP